jgi:hypothetical protein
MAFTASVLVKGVAFGNQLVKVFNVTADAAAGSFDTGLKSINFSQVTSVSSPTNPVVADNKGPTGTTTAGTLAITNCTSGNVYRAIVYGY